MERRSLRACVTLMSREIASAAASCDTHTHTHTHTVCTCLSKLCAVAPHKAVLGAAVRVVSNGLLFGKSFIRIWSRIPHVFVHCLRGFTQSLRGNTRIEPHISVRVCVCVCVK